MRSKSTRVRQASVLLLICLAGTNVLDAQTKVTSIDYFGLRTIEQADIEAALDIKTGEPLGLSVAEIASRVKAIEGVADVNVAPVQYPGNLALFIGVRESAQATARFRDPPEGDVKLDPDLGKRYRRLMQMLMPAIRAGKAGEDRSAGHSISEYEPMQKRQKELIPIADEQFDMLATVLQESADVDSRTAAAHIIAYATDKSRVAEVLQYACDDADPGVRNNAVRALSVLGAYANENPEVDLDVDPSPFIQLLGSVTWTDRNKGSAAMDSLTKTRNPELLKALKERAMPELIEMAKWKSDGHAFFAIRIIARLADVPEDEIIAKSRQLKNHEDRASWVDELLETIAAAG